MQKLSEEEARARVYNCPLNAVLSSLNMSSHENASNVTASVSEALIHAEFETMRKTLSEESGADEMQAE